MSGGAINGIPIVRATAVLPASGVGHVDVHVADGAELTGAAEVEIAGLVLRGTVDEGGPYVEQGWYRVVLGANRWNVSIPARPYRNAAGVKLRTLVEDAAREAGETIDATGVSDIVGPAYARAAGPASAVLNAFSPRAWYVDELGVTRIGRRPTAPIAIEYATMNRAPDLRLFEIAPTSSLVGVVPGVQIEGFTVSEVRHELTPKTLRSHLWCDVADIGTSTADNLRAIIQAVTARQRFSAVFEYVVTAASETHLDARPVRKAAGLPSLANVPMWVGAPGTGGQPREGSTVGIGFLDGDPTRPAVMLYEGPRGGRTPETAHMRALGRIDLGGNGDELLAPAFAVGRVVRYGDPIQFSVPGTVAPITYVVPSPVSRVSA